MREGRLRWTRPLYQRRIRPKMVSGSTPTASASSRTSDTVTLRRPLSMPAIVSRLQPSFSGELRLAEVAIAARSRPHGHHGAVPLLALSLLPLPS